jgi:hypothetical protein
MGIQDHEAVIASTPGHDVVGAMVIDNVVGLGLERRHASPPSPARLHRSHMAHVLLDQTRHWVHPPRTGNTMSLASLSTLITSSKYGGITRIHDLHKYHDNFSTFGPPEPYVKWETVGHNYTYCVWHHKKLICGNFRRSQSNSSPLSIIFTSYTIVDQLSHFSARVSDIFYFLYLFNRANCSHIAWLACLPFAMFVFGTTPSCSKQKIFSFHDLAESLYKVSPTRHKMQ